MVQIVSATSRDHLAHIRTLFLEYAASLPFALCFQNFERELATLPGLYAPPDGCLLLALDDDRAVGCAGLRKIAPAVCEMKRMYVRPDYRGRGIGRGLAAALIERAREIGYTAMRLDTIASMVEAVALYRSLGFSEIAPYYENPVAGATYMELDLQLRT